MPTEYPYANSTVKIPTLFEKIVKVGPPAKVDNRWLQQIGFGSSNDRRLTNVLRHIGFTGDRGEPTSRWHEYRGAKQREVLGEAIREGYADLYHTYPDAHDASNDDLTKFIRTSTGLGDATVAKAVATFKALAALASFDGSSSGSAAASSSNGKVSESSEQSRSPQTDVESRTTNKGFAITVNLQLTLPESTDPAVYDALFASLNKHVLSGGSVA